MNMHSDENLEGIRQDERDRHKPVTDELLGSVGVSATGMPVGSIVSIERPENYSVSPEGLPNNIQTERYLKAIGMLKPHVTPEVVSELQGEVIEGEKVSYRPDFPTFEMNYNEPNGLQIQMSIQLPDEMRKYYDMDMALNSLGYRMTTLLQDISLARHLDEESDDAEGEPAGE